MIISVGIIEEVVCVMDIVCLQCTTNWIFPFNRESQVLMYIYLLSLINEWNIVYLIGLLCLYIEV